MKKLLILFIWGIAVSFAAHGQLKLGPFPNADTYPVSGTLLKDKDYPLIIIGTFETNTPSLIMNADNLSIIKYYKDPEDLKFFGEKGSSGVLVAELINNIPLFRLEEVIDYFKVAPANRHLPVLVNKNAVNPDLFLADIKLIKKVEVLEVTQEDVLLSLYYNNLVKGERYLNIVTEAQ